MSFWDAYHESAKQVNSALEAHSSDLVYVTFHPT